MDLIQAIIFGFIQGVTEWLPISSTGHLRISQHLFGLSLPLLFDVLLHVGTLAIVLVFFRKDIKLIIAALVRGDFDSENGKLIPLIIVGMVPTTLIGMFFSNAIEEYFSSFLSMAGAFTICGLVLYFSKTGTENEKSITYKVALAMGIAQGIAIIPGLSRSGLTIATALMFGVRREKAFSFSFLLYFPAVIGALGFTLFAQHEALALRGVDWTEIFVGIAVSLVASYFALKLLWKVLASQKFHLLAFYCWLIGILLFALSFSSS
jgi:undecaprenyl-diphosphatase